VDLEAQVVPGVLAVQTQLGVLVVQVIQAQEHPRVAL
jgi:hypothetical protein